MGALPKEELSYTYADYKGWELDKGERYELIYVEAYAMVSPGARHQAILMEISSYFHVFLRGYPCKVFPAPFDVRLFYKKNESVVYPVKNSLTVYCFQNDFIVTKTYKSTETVAVTILPGLNIPLEQVFEE